MSHVLDHDLPHRSRSALAVATVAALCTACTCDRGPDRPGALPRIVAVKLPGDAITIDGRLDEPAWRRAASTGPFVRPGTGRPAPASPVAGSARVAWTDTRLLVGFTVHDRDPSSPFDREAEDPHIWARSSGVELMLQPGDPGDNRHYFEIQVDVHGAVWDTRFDDYNRPMATGPDGERRYGHQRWDSEVQRAARVEAAAGRYVIELGVPWSALENPRARTPPRSGDVWRVNLYTFRDGQREALAWSPILGRGNFHKAARFGRIVFR